MGIGSETYVTYGYYKFNKLENYYSLDNNAGIYYNHISDIITYCEKYNNSLKHK